MTGTFANQEKGGNRYTVDALKLANPASRVFDECVWSCKVWKIYLFCWIILAISDQSLTSNGSIADSNALILALGHKEATYN